MTDPKKEPRIEAGEKVQINFSKGFRYEYLIMTPKELGFNDPLPLSVLYTKLKERKSIQYYEGRFPAIVDTSFITSVSIDKQHVKGVE